MIEAEAIEVKVYDKNGNQIIYRFGEPGSGRTIRSLFGYNIEYDREIGSFEIPMYHYPTKREFTMRVDY